MVLVKKKDGSWQFYIDYRSLNKVMAKDAHRLLRIDESLNSLGHSKYLSTLDLTSSYRQVEKKKRPRRKRLLPLGIDSTSGKYCPLN